MPRPELDDPRLHFLLQARRKRLTIQYPRCHLAVSSERSRLQARFQRGLDTAAGLAPARVEVMGAGPIGASGSIPLGPGSYEINVSASGYDSVRVTREVLPGITTSLEVRLRSTIAQVTPVQQPAEPQQPVAPPPHKGGIPWWVKVGAAGGVLWAILWNVYIKSH